MESKMVLFDEALKSDAILADAYPSMTFLFNRRFLFETQHIKISDVPTSKFVYGADSSSFDQEYTNIQPCFISKPGEFYFYQKFNSESRYFVDSVIVQGNVIDQVLYKADNDLIKIMPTREIGEVSLKIAAFTRHLQSFAGTLHLELINNFVVSARPMPLARAFEFFDIEIQKTMISLFHKRSTLESSSSLIG